MMQMDGSIAESNREEARRAKEIAVEKYKAGDLSGAKEYAVKAKDLDPQLCGLLRLNAVLDVRTAFAKKINGELTDWYAVLAVDPTADLETIKSGFKKLALDILFDRDESVGSIVEAQEILADAWKFIENVKSSYDSSRQMNIFVQDTRKNGGRCDRREISPTMIKRALAEKARNTIKLSLERSISASQHYNVGVADDAEDINPLEYNMVQENDFYNFDKDRAEASFGENEVWAAYGYDDMPRFYALVHSVVSQEPFKLRISWLDITNDDEPATKKWVGSGFSKTSGRFAIREHINTVDPKVFSHRLKWTKDAEGFIHIYPAKGDVWAIYKNWSTSWAENGYDEEECSEFEIVEVVEDFDEEIGLMVLPLMKVPGFKAVFRRDSNPFAFSIKELLMFSHQVVYHRLTGQEGENVPEDCLELDPAALSGKLLGLLTLDELLTDDEMSE
ncbi:hypothetical protein CARUB_v10028594mg [Capsella rubella]|uniref:J domain-containing protein n=1 Tax=Capsella rubella TaxID=81985 RepID=R0GMP0_9BRAS|nr:hypothetical protein CARUB_v10028594mg [Capsella rubella]